MSKLKESAKKTFNRIPQKYIDDAKDVFKSTYKYVRTAAIVKIVQRLTELKR
jgi:ribosomal protein S20